MTQTALQQVSTHYPHLASAFADLPDAEAHLRRMQDLNSAWQHMLTPGSTRTYTEVVVIAERPALPLSATFDIIYAGGGLNLLNAAVMTRRYGLRVIVFDRFTVGAVHREWNISREELQELLDVGLLTCAPPRRRHGLNLAYCLPAKLWTPVLAGLPNGWHGRQRLQARQ